MESYYFSKVIIWVFRNFARKFAWLLVIQFGTGFMPLYLRISAAAAAAAAMWCGTIILIYRVKFWVAYVAAANDVESSWWFVVACLIGWCGSGQ